jgi:hypothetical protein
MIVGSALMVNLRRIHRYVSEKIKKNQSTTGDPHGEPTPAVPAVSFFVALRTFSARRRWLRALGC